MQDAFARALEVWPLRGIPDNPAAWLMTTAKNRALDLLRRELRGRAIEPELRTTSIDEAFAEHTIRDEQLRMMFSCSDPALPEPVQVALILNILCGFGANEVAHAFLTGRAAMEKRISRGKQTLGRSRSLFDLTDAEFPARLSAVKRALYLLFSEGYHGASPDAAVRVDLCQEALRLIRLLRAYPPAATPETSALAALMCLHAARLPARLDPGGDLTPLAEQDRSRWDTGLVAEGLAYLEQSAHGDAVSAYHIEAAIAATHAGAASVAETDWPAIVALYDRLMAIAPSPVVALNRAIAVGQRDGAAGGLAALRTIADRERLDHYPFYHAALGDFQLRLRDRRAALAHFTAALAVARNDTERRFLEQRIAST